MPNVFGPIPTFSNDELREMQMHIANLFMDKTMLERIDRAFAIVAANVDVLVESTVKRSIGPCLQYFIQVKCESINAPEESPLQAISIKAVIELTESPAKSYTFNLQSFMNIPGIREKVDVRREPGFLYVGSRAIERNFAMTLRNFYSMWRVRYPNNYAKSLIQTAYIDPYTLDSEAAKKLVEYLMRMKETDVKEPSEWMAPTSLKNIVGTITKALPAHTTADEPHDIEPESAPGEADPRSIAAMLRNIPRNE